MLYHFADHARPLNPRLADVRLRAVGIEQDAAKFDARSCLAATIVHSYNIAFTDPILPRTIFKNGVHSFIPPLQFVCLQQHPEKFSLFSWHDKRVIRCKNITLSTAPPSG